MEASNQIIQNLSVSDIIQLIGIISAVIPSIIAIIISVITLRQNSRMLEENSRAVLSIYTQTLDTGSPALFLVIKNFGHASAVIERIDSDFEFKNCYPFKTSHDYVKDLVGSTLAPNQSRIIYLDHAKVDCMVSFILEYRSIGRLYREKFEFNPTAAACLPVPKTATNDRELRTISYTLQEMLQKNL